MRLSILSICLLLLINSGVQAQHLFDSKYDTAAVKKYYNTAKSLLYDRPDSTLKMARLGMKWSQRNKDRKQEGDFINTMAQAYYILGNFPEALQYYYLALDLRQKINDEAGRAVTLSNLGKLMGDQKEYEKAIDNTRLALSINQSIHNEKRIIIDNLNMGDYFEKLNRFDSARKYTTDGYELALKLNELEQVGAFLTNLGNIHTKMNQANLAMEYYRLSIPYLEKAEDYTAIAEAYMGMAKLFMVNKAIDSSLHYSRKAMRVSRDKGLLLNTFQASNFIAQYFKSVKNTDSAYHYQEIALSAKDSLFSEEKIKEVQKMTFEQKIRQQEEDERELLKTEERHTNLRIGGIAMFIPAFLLLITLLGKTKVQRRTIQFFGTIGVLLTFEFINLLIHPMIERLTHHNSILMLLIMVGLAAILIPLHHRIEHWFKEKIFQRNQLAAKAIETKTEN